MAEQYYNRKEQLIETLKIWANETITNKLWTKFANLHIDEIDIEFKEKDTWIDGSLFLFDCMYDIIDKSAYDILLVIRLSYTSIPNSENTITLKDLKHELDITPPSFYLFPLKEKNYEDTIASAKFLENISKAIRLKVYYKEDENEYSRTLYLKR